MGGEHAECDNCVPRCLTDRLICLAGEGDLVSVLHALVDVNLERLLLLDRLLSVALSALIVRGDLRPTAAACTALLLCLL